MELNNIKPASGSKHSKKRVGRGIGSGLGKTAGRGHKGQKSRSGYSSKRGFEGGQMPLQKRLPKFGFYSRVGGVTVEVRTSELAKLAGDVVNMKTLEEANLIDRSAQRVRIMLSGAVDRRFTVEGIAVTKGAKAAIEASGGKVV